MNVNEHNGIAINVREAKENHPFKLYEPGLPHIALNAGSAQQVDDALKIVQQAAFRVLDGPGESSDSNPEPLRDAPRKTELHFHGGLIRRATPSKV